MRILTIILGAVILSGLVLFIIGPTEKPKSNPAFTVVTSFTLIADITREIAGDTAIVLSITPPGADIHDYQPTPQDIARASQADLILWHGLNLERWFSRFLDTKIPSVVVSKNIDPLSIYDGPYTGKPNPHAWMSFDNAVIYTTAIRDALIQYNPEHEAVYRANARTYSQQFSQLKATAIAALAFIPEDKRYLVTSEGAFPYWAADFGFKDLYLWPINADQNGTPQQISRIINLIRTHDIPVIFSESTISDKPARQVAQETGIYYGGQLYVDSLSDPDGPVPSYVDLLTYTTQTIITGFKTGLDRD